MAESGTKVGSLFWGMTLDTKDFKKKVKDIKKRMKKFGKDMRQSMINAAKGVALAVTGMVAGLAAIVKSSADVINMQNILADSIGATQSEIAALELAADSMGVSYDQLIDKMREAGGIDAFKQMADDVRSAGDQTAQLAKAQELLGNEGLKLLPILRLGSKGMEDFEREARRLGLALDPQQTEDLVSVWSEYEKLMQEIRGVVRLVAVEFSSMFKGALSGARELIEFFRNNIPNMLEILADIPSLIGEVLIISIKKFLKTVIKLIIGAFQTIGNLIIGTFIDAIAASLEGLLGQLAKFSDKAKEALVELRKSREESNKFFTIDPEEINRRLNKIGLLDTTKDDKKLESIFSSFLDRFQFITSDLKDVAIADPTEGKSSAEVSKGFATTLKAGSVSAFKAIFAAEDKTTELQKVQIEEAKKTNKILGSGRSGGVLDIGRGLGSGRSGAIR